MKYLKYLCFLVIGMVACTDNEPVEIVEDFSGIEYTTSRSSGSASGIGFACNFSDLIDDDRWTDFDLNQSFYGIIAGDSIDLEDNPFLSAGESFRILWVNEGEISAGTYEAFGMSLNVEDPENLEDGVTATFSDAVEVILERVGADVMEGQFKGTFQNESGEEESLEGRFNVERTPCQ